MNASNYLDILGDPFNPTPLPINKRKRRESNSIDTNESLMKNSSGYDNDLKQKFETYNVEAEVITYDMDNEQNDDNEKYENAIDEEYLTTLDDLKIKQPNNLDTARWTLYKGIETLAETYSY